MTRAIQDPGPEPVLAEPPFFIVGLSRSGTTLLQSILAAHSRLAVTPETHFCKTSERLAGVPLDRAPSDFDVYFDAYCRTRRFASVEVTPERCRELAARQAAPGFTAAFRALLAAYLEKTGKARIGEKTPGHFYYAEWIFDTFPDARMFAMQRDPRAMIASVLKTPWRKAENDPATSHVSRLTRLHAVARDAKRWAEVNGRLFPRLARDPRVMRLRYEDLVREPETHVREVCALLGETFEPTMLSDRSAQAGFDAKAAGWDRTWSSWIDEHQASANAPVSTRSLEKWRQELTEREVAAIEALAGPVMERLGYADFASTPTERRRARAAAEAALLLDRVERRARRGVRSVRRRTAGGGAR